MPRWFIALLGAFVALSIGCTGPKGDAGAKGDKGDPGDPGAVGATGPVGATGAVGATGTVGASGPAGPTGPQGEGATTGTVAGTVKDGVLGNALSGVTVAAKDAGGGTIDSATTDTNGAFSLSLPSGSMSFTFTKQYFTSPGAMSVGVYAGRTVTLAVTMNEAASGKPSVALSAPGNDVGYGATVHVTATASDPNGDALTYSWSNATVPPLGSVSGSGADGTVQMPSLDEAFAFRADVTNPGQFLSGVHYKDLPFGILPIISDARGQITTSLTVADGRGQSSTATLVINAASVNGGVRNVAVGTRVYLNSGHDGTSTWTLTSAPSGSAAALDDPASRTPSFVADKKGTYAFTEGNADAGAPKTLSIEAGNWVGAIAGGSGDDITVDSTCLLCHDNSIAPDKFTSWKKTGHATFMTRGINGETSNHYAGSCIECHTVGYDSGVANGGFDDVAQQSGWTFPASYSPDNWSEMVATTPAAARLANIQCENCHGPNDSAAHTKTMVSNLSRPFLSPRISYGAESCAQCHGSGAHHFYSEWNVRANPNGADPDDTQSLTAIGHANRVDARTLGSSASGLASSCGRCHTAQGYVLYSGLLEKGKFALNSVPADVMASVTSANAEPVTCVACHDPHDASNPNQLRIYGDTPLLPGGFAGYGMGKGALCLSCHNSRNGAQGSSDTLAYLHEDLDTFSSGNPTAYSAPHQAAQGDVFTGHNAYFLGAAMPMTSRHAAIENTCVGCHMELNPVTFSSHGTPAHESHMFRIEDADLQTLCSNCHGDTVNGEGIQAEVEAQLGNLGAKLGTAAMAKINAAGTIKVRAYEAAEDVYSSSSSSNCNVTVDVSANPVVAVGIEEGHGQIELHLTFTNTITGIPFVNGAGQSIGTRDLNEFGVQLGSLKNGSSTVLYALTGNFVKAGWNYFLIHGDQSKGLHNPSFVNAVLNASLAKDVSN